MRTSLCRYAGRFHPSTLTGDELAGCDKGLDGRAGLLGLEPEVVAQALLGADPVGLGRDHDELTERVVVRRSHIRRDRLRGNGFGEDAFEGGIASLELRGAAGAADPARPEEVLDGGLDQGPVPSPFGLVPRQVVLERGLELAGGERPARGDLREYGLDELGVLERDALHAAPGVGQRALHPEVQQGPGLRWDQARLVRPVLDEAARTDVAGPVEQGRVVGTEAGEEREVLAAGEDVDAVDLDDADAVDHPLDVAHGRLARRRPGVGEPLRHDGDAPGLGLGQPGDVAGHVSTLLA